MISVLALLLSLALSAGHETHWIQTLRKNDQTLTLILSMHYVAPKLVSKLAPIVKAADLVLIEENFINGERPELEFQLAKHGKHVKCLNDVKTALMSCASSNLQMTFTDLTEED